MTCTVLIFGHQAISAGTRSLAIEVAATPCTAADVLAAIGAASPALLPSLASSRLAVNHEFADAGQLISGREELALIGMVSGELIEGPLGASAASPVANGAGAALVFEGIVRGKENDRPLAALVYEAYEPMTTRVLAQIAAAAGERFGLSSIAVHHSVGRVAVGECSFRLALTSPHRKESLAAAAWFIDEMKRTAPLWKVPAWE
jgi:molybdopterin synthase catalytic subunit